MATSGARVLFKSRAAARTPGFGASLLSSPLSPNRRQGKDVAPLFRQRVRNFRQHLMFRAPFYEARRPTSTRNGRFNLPVETSRPLFRRKRIISQRDWKTTPKKRIKNGMKRWVVISAWIALFALLMPCTHAGELHRHNGSAEADVPVSVESHCCACHSEPCSEPETMLSKSSVTTLSLPTCSVELMPVISSLDSAAPSSFFSDRHHLYCLRTVQLLI